MGDEPLTNAAVEFMRAAFVFANVMERHEFTGSEMTDDFVLDDRRHGFNYGLLDKAGILEMTRSLFDVGSGRPTWSTPEVLAVRGQRIAALTSRINYGNDTYTEFITCIRLDPQLQLAQRRANFDIDARDEAIALLDEWHAEIDD